MFVPPSPSQPADTPGSARRPTPLPGQGKALGEEGSGAEGGSAGRMVDKRRRPESADNADSKSSNTSGGGGRGGGKLPAAVAADQEKPAPISLSEAKKILDGDDWRAKVAALRQLENQLAAAEEALDTEDSRDVVNLMESLAAVCRALKNTKPEIASAARVTQLVCAVISGLARAVGSGFCASAAAIIPDLLPFLSTPREAVQEAVATSVEDMLAECPSPSVLRASTVPLVGSKKAYLRRKGSAFLCVAIERWPPSALRTTLPPIMSQMRKALFDADATVRREGRHTFGVFIRLWPAEGGGMYHALDRANQRAVLQEQPHVSNFIGGKTIKDGTPSSGGNGAPAATKPTSSVSETSSSTSAVPMVDESTAAAASASASASASAAASAATRMAMAKGKGGGGGQRPAGVTQAQHRSLVALKVERDRRLKGQQRLAAAGVTKPPSSSSSSYAGQVAGGGGSGGQGFYLSSIPAVMSAPSSPTTAGATAAGPSANSFGFLSPHGSHSAAGASRPSCSDGLRRAARLALSKNDLMPTVERLLQDPAHLRTATSGGARVGYGEAAPSTWTDAEAGAGVSSPGSEESGLDTEGDGAGAAGGRMTPGELRGSTSGAVSPVGGSSSVGNESYLTTCGGVSSEDEEFDSDEEAEEDDEDGGGSTTGGGRKQRPPMPSRILFGLDHDDEVKPPPPPESPKQQRTLAIARTAANSSAARYAALEMKPPPPRPPAAAPVSTLPATTTDAASANYEHQQHPKLKGDLGCPSPRGGAVAYTPTKSILADRSGKGSAAPSSTVKRRVRFEMEERAREAASLNSPCRSSSSATAGWWSRGGAADGDGQRDSGGERGRRSHGPVRHRLSVVLRALAGAVLVGTVAYLGRDDGGGRSVGHGVVRRPAGCYPSSSLESSDWSPGCLPWAIKLEAEVCPSAAGLEGAARFFVEEQEKGPERAAEQPEGEGAPVDVVKEAPGAVVVDDVVVERPASTMGAATQAQGAWAGATDASADDVTGASAADPDHEVHQPLPAELHRYHYPGEAGSSIVGTAEDSSPTSPSGLRSDTVWGWVEVGAATLSALMLLAGVVWRSRGAVDGVDGWGDGDGGGDGPSTPLAGGDGGDGDGQELGRYQTMEMVKKGDTPATIRSVKRSWRIGSAQKPAPPGMLVVDLGAAALNMPSTPNA